MGRKGANSGYSEATFVSSRPLIWLRNSPIEGVDSDSGFMSMLCLFTNKQNSNKSEILSRGKFSI